MKLIPVLNPWTYKNHRMQIKCKMSISDTQNNNCLILITKLFSVIITVGHILTIWKKGLVIPVHKGGSTPSQKYESYIPIALLCSFYQTFWEDYILKNSILVWNIFSYITKQAAAWIHRILKLYYNDFYSVWSHVVCFRTSQYYICCLSWHYAGFWYGLACKTH